MSLGIQIKLAANGSFAVCSAGQIWLSDCFPAIDGRPLRAIAVDQANNQLTYHTIDGDVVLTVHQEAQDRCNLQLALQSFTRPIHRFSVFQGVATKELVGMYQSSGQLGEECGYHAVTRMQKRRTLVSRGLIALCIEGQTLLCYVQDHTRFHQEYGMEQTMQGAFAMAVDFRLEHANKANEVLPTVYFALQEDLDEALRIGATQIGQFMQARTQKPAAYHWCSWYYNYSEFDQKQMTEYLTGFQTVPITKSFQYFQIDAGYSAKLGDWLTPRTRWPKGLNAAVQEIAEAGFRPGIWIGPFMVGNQSALAKNHPDWLLCDLEGSPLIGMRTDNEPKLWGYHDEEYYILDSSHPDAMRYLQKVFQTMKGWGVELFKTDFMLWGYQDSTKVQRHTPGKTSVEHFREVLDMIRAEIGEETYWLGCIAPFFPFIGYADGMRIGGDVGSSWDGEFNPKNMIMTVKGNYFTNGLYYQNDPDAIFFRDFHIRLKDHEIEALALYAALSGGCVYTSDPVHQLREDRLKLLEFLRPADQKQVPKFPYQQQDRDEIVLTHFGKTQGKGLLFVFNPTEREIVEKYDLVSLGFAKTVWVAEKGQAARKEEQTIFLRIPAHGHRLLILANSSDVQFSQKNLWNNLEKTT